MSIDVFGRFVYLLCCFCDVFNIGVGKFDIYVFSCYQCFVLYGDRGIWFGQNMFEVVGGQCLQFNVDWQMILQFWDQVRWFCNLECVRSDKQNVVSFDYFVFGGNGVIFYQWQQVMLNVFMRNIWIGRFVVFIDFVDFVDKYDFVLFNSVDSVLFQFFWVYQFCCFFFNQQFYGVFDFQFMCFLFLVVQVLEYGLQLVGYFFYVWRSYNFNVYWCCGKIDFDFFVIKLVFMQFFVECLMSSGWFLLLFGLFLVVFSRWDQYVENMFFCQFFSVIMVFFDSLDVYYFYGGIGQIVNNRIYFFIDVVYFGEFGCFNFDEWCICQFSQMMGDFSFIDIGWVDYQDIFWGYFMAQLFVELYVMLVVMQSNCYRMFGVVLVDDVFIQFVDDFVWGYFRYGRFLCFVV